MVCLVRCPLAYYAEEFRVPDGIVIIESGAFKGCKNIGKIILPESVQEIGSSAFANCLMTSINMPKSISKIGYMAFWECVQIETFIIPENVTEVEDYLLYNCKKLNYLEIPEGVKKIASTAFYGCESLKTIKCNIKDIENLAVEPSYDGSYRAFYGVPSDCSWLVPAGPNGSNDPYYANLYKAQPWWVPTWNIIIATDINDAITYDYGISWNSGQLFIAPNSNGTINIYSVSGSLIKSINGKSGEQYQIEIPRGLYIINNKKVMLK